MLSVNSISGKFAVNSIFSFVACHSGLNSTCIRTNRYNKDTCIFRPYCSKERTSDRGGNINCIICNKYNCCAVSYRLNKSLIINRYYIVACITIFINNSIVEIRFNKIIGHYCIYRFPISKINDLVCRTNVIKFQVSLWTYVQIYICYIIAII